jgi:hypothetical protein
MNMDPAAPFEILLSVRERAPYTESSQGST